MNKIAALILLITILPACSPTKEEVTKQEKEYDRIADSVLKSSEKYNDGVGSVVDSLKTVSDSL